jgi:DNA topoisomerase-1
MMSLSSVDVPAGAPLIPIRQLKKLRKDPALTAAAAGLKYIRANAAGFLRKGKAPRFFYIDSNGSRIKEKNIIKRIKALALPPAWQNVWISVDPDSHLQATGTDEAGRKQYRYHPHWNLIRNQAKYYRLLNFSETLPNLREQVTRDLRRHKPDLNKQIALVVRIMDKTCMRVGNERYKVKHGSSGITTLDARCASATGTTVRFVFKGKKGIRQDITVRDRQISTLIKQNKNMKGRRLFQYYDDSGSLRALKASQVNDYIRRNTGADFSAKDFRTWMGTVTAFSFLVVKEKYASQREYTRTINTCLDVVANHLGNTRTVCKKYYVHPVVFRAYETGKIQRFLNKPLTASDYLTVDEQQLKLLLANPVS